jgi:hypothetical protein
MPRRRIDAAVVVFALLIAATVVAFAYAQHLKRDPLIVDRVRPGKHEPHAFTPNGDCHHDSILLGFRTTTSNRGTVQVIDPDGTVVKTLWRDHFFKRYTEHGYSWVGGTDSGAAPAGRYRVRVELAGEGRTLELPGTIKLHRVPAQPTNAEGAGKVCSTLEGPVTPPPFGKGNSAGGKSS